MKYCIFTILICLSILALNLSCVSQDETRNLKFWESLDQNENSITFNYSVDSKSANLYFSKNRPDCIRSGWITCEYIRSMRIEFRRNGQAIVHELQFNSDLTSITPSTVKWTKKNDFIQLHDMKLLFQLNTMGNEWFDNN